MNKHTSRILRFLITGIVGLSVNLGLYHAFVSRFGIPYLLGSMLALLYSIIVGFLLQKYWTFAEREHARAPQQFALYAVIAVGNLVVNTAIVFVIVEYVGWHYLVAQAIGSGVLAVSSFLLYHHYVFAARHVDKDSGDTGQVLL